MTDIIRSSEEKKESGLNLSNKNRLTHDILLGNISQESLEYLGIIKKSIQNKTEIVTKDFEKLSEQSRKELFEFFDSYNNPAKWKIIDNKRNFHSENQYRGEYDMKEIIIKMVEYGGSVGFELMLWGNGDYLLGADLNGNIDRVKLGQGYNITEETLKSFRNLINKIESLKSYFDDIRHIKINKKCFRIEKGTITTPPINGRDFNGIETVTAQNDFRFLEKFLIKYLKGDIIGTDWTYDNPISPTRHSDSFIFHITAELTPYVEIELNGKNWHAKINLIQTQDNDWMAITNDSIPGLKELN